MLLSPTRVDSAATHDLLLNSLALIIVIVFAKLWMLPLSRLQNLVLPVCHIWRDQGR